MSLGTALSTLKTQLQAAVGDSLVVVNQQTTTIYGQLLSDKQQWLAGLYDFPYLKKRWTAGVQPNTRFYANPTTSDAGDVAFLDFSRPFHAMVSWTNQWIPVDYGIDEDPEFNQYQSDPNMAGWAVQTNDPVQRWQMYGSSQYEVWPIPSTAQFFRFIGQIAIPALAQPTDTAFIDDQLLVAAVAVDLLSKKKDSGAQARLANEKQRLSNLISNYQQRTREVTIGGGTLRRTRSLRRVVPIITIKG